MKLPMRSRCFLLLPDVGGVQLLSATKSVRKIDGYHVCLINR